MLILKSIPSLTFRSEQIMTKRYSLMTTIFLRSMSSRPAARNSDATAKRSKVTLTTIANLKRSDTPITMMTAHDYPSSMVCDHAGIDVILVGDSLAMVALGQDSTTSITMFEMLHHSRAVKLGSQYAFLVGDLPFGSYQSSCEMAVTNAVRYLQEGGMEAVKMEGGNEMMCRRVKSVVQAGIPVVGHIGLTPQSQSQLGGYRVQGKTSAAAITLVRQALALQDAGVSMLVLEAIPAPVAKQITDLLSVPTIGIGAGHDCSGQVLVQQDMLGIFDKFLPSFCKIYENIGKASNVAMKQYVKDVQSRSFPAEEHTYPMSQEELEMFLEAFKTVK